MILSLRCCFKPSSFYVFQTFLSNLHGHFSVEKKSKLKTKATVWCILCDCFFSGSHLRSQACLLDLTDVLFRWSGRSVLTVQESDSSSLSFTALLCFRLWVKLSQAAIEQHLSVSGGTALEERGKKEWKKERNFGKHRQCNLKC